VVKRIVLVNFALALLLGCSSTGRYLEDSEGPITARVLPVGPPTWTYDIVTTGIAPITNLGFVTKADLSQCTFRLEPDGPEIKARKSEEGLTVQLPELNRMEVRFTINCKEGKKGLIRLQIVDDARIVRVVGPLEGPG